MATLKGKGAILWRHRPAEWLWLGGTSGGHLVLTSGQVRSCRISCPGLCADGFWIFKSMDTPQPFGATCTHAQSPSCYKCFLMIGGKVLCFSLCPLSLVLSLDTAVIFTLFLQVFAHTVKIPLEPSLFQDEKSQLSALSHTRNAPVPYSF